MHIVFEGCDGSGKSTLSNMFYDDLLKWRTTCRGFLDRDFKLHRAAQPGGTLYGEELVKIIRNSKIHLTQDAIYYLMLSSHHQFVREVLMPIQSELSGGRAILIQDRHSAISGYAYSVVAGNISYGRYLAGYGDRELITVGTPDLVIVFKPTLQNVMKRIASRGSKVVDRFEKEATLKKVLQGYADFKNNPISSIINGDRILTIEGNSHIMVVYKKVLKVIAKHPRTSTTVKDFCRYRLKKMEN